MNIPLNSNGERLPPITTASKILLEYIQLPPKMTKELALSACRYERRQHLIFQHRWWYWNQVLNYIKEWDGEFPVNY